jgi:RNA 2',3'-cyclic 3'-phosphodiesterase
LRVFLALEIPGEVRAAIGELIHKLEKTCRGARCVRPEGVHVTLKFIGEAAPERVEQIQARLAGIRVPAPVELQFRGVGFFPNDRHPRVFWAGILATRNLAELAASIERELAPLGILREGRPFKPHLTLARFKSEDGLSRLRETIASAGAIEFGAMRGESFHLYESRLKSGGAEYTKLATFPFVENAR